MSSPLLWFGNKAKLLKSILQIPGSTSGSIDLAAPATPTPYQITLPPAQGTIGQVPTLDASLNLQWATPSSNPVTTFPLVNNQVTPANVTGFLVNSAVNTAFHAEVSVRQEATVTVVGGNDGTPNATFQTNAGATGANDQVNASIVLPSGDVIIAGNFTAYNGIATPRIAKISSLGVLDTAFTANLGTGPDNQVFALHLQSSGKIVIGGGFSNVDGSAFNKIARLNADGSLDAAFGNTSGQFNGLVYDIASLSATNNENLIVVGTFTSFVAEDLATYPAPSVLGLRADGKYVVPGIVFVPTGTGFDTQASCVKVDLATDNVFIGGEFNTYNGVSAFRSIKTDATGAKQSGFDSLGNASTVGAYDVVIQPDGKVVFAGGIYRSATDIIDIFRYTSAGAADTTFNNNLSLASGAFAEAVGLQSDGKILLGGNDDYNSVRRLCRINSDGTDDTTFNTAISPGFDVGSGVKTISIGADDVAYVGGYGITTFGPSSPAVSDNIIMLGQFGSVTTTETWLKTAIDGVYTSVGLDWEIGFDTGVVSSPAPGVAFTMLPSGQLQYTTTNLAGTIALNEMRFSIVGL